MKLKNLLFSAVLGIASYVPAKAQLANGTVAPNFNLADINGVTHNLYALLDSGYNVVIDFSAVWCGPCWGYHNSGALENLYHNYGPDGTNEVRVFFIEGDGLSTMNELNGIGGGTQGNWVAGTEYPIILTSDASGTSQVVSNYQIGYFPTVYVICASDKKVKKVDQMPYTQLKNEVFSCAPTRTNDAMADQYLGTTYVCNAGESVSGQFKFRNRGLNPITSLILRAYQGSTLLFTQPWTGNVASAAVGTINVPSFVVNNTGDIRFELDLPSDQLVSNDDLITTFDVAQDASSLQIQVKIKADNWGSEIGWFLEKEDGTLIQNINPGTYPDQSQQTYTYNHTLADNDCFNFTITDDYGDGICCAEGVGYYVITDVVSGDTLLYGAEYGSEDFGKITTGNGTVSVDNKSNSLVLISVYPNPSNGQLTVEFAQKSSSIITLQDVLGKEVFKTTKNSDKEILDFSHLQAGSYVVSIVGEGINSKQTIQIVK